MQEISVLQFGIEDWSLKYKAPAYVKWKMMDRLPYMDEKIKADAVFITRRLADDEIPWIMANVMPHTVFISDAVPIERGVKTVLKRKMARVLPESELGRIIQEELKFFFSYSYGEKYSPARIEISKNFHGDIKRNGFRSIELNGDFGGEYAQAMYWKLALPIEPGQVIEFWLEYEADEGVDIKLEFTQFARGSIAMEDLSWEFDMDDLKDVVYIENTTDHRANYFASLSVKGRGRLAVTALHDRHSRRGWGVLVPGGERYVTSAREELLCYFDPGDMKPPLNIYFAGYRTQEGFEGRHMMNTLGCPFLLIADNRLEGGAFYIGSEEYEEMVRDVIKKYMDMLGFTSGELMFSGISMGTHGALYYGCDFLPHAVILGKPLANLGDVARNEKYSRPGVFPTSLDVLMSMEGTLKKEAVEKLNARFWNKFDKTVWPDTTFIISYMIEDDYDAGAYRKLTEHLASAQATVYGKGIHGRHNDDTRGIVDWFTDQYKEVLRSEFGRKDKT